MSNFKMDGSKGKVHLSGANNIEDWLCRYKEKLILSGLTLLVVIGLGQITLKNETVDYEELTSVISTDHNPDVMMNDIIQNDIVKIVSYTDDNGTVKDIKSGYGTVINNSGTAFSHGYNAILTTKSNLELGDNAKIKIYVNNKPLNASINIITSSHKQDDIATISIVPQDQESKKIYSNINGINLAQILPKSYSIDMKDDHVIPGTPILTQIDGNYELIGMIGASNMPVNLKAENSDTDMEIGQNGVGNFFHWSETSLIPDIKNHVIYGLGKPGEEATFVSSRSYYKNALMPVNGLSYEISLNTPNKKNVMGYGL